VAGRHRNTHRLLGIKLVAGLVVLIAAVAVGWGGYRLATKPSCSSRATLRIAAAPEIAPVIQATGNTWSASQKSGTCVTVAVTAVDPADVAAAVAAKQGAAVTGLGQANGKVQVPDVWIPDSSTWLDRIRSVDADLVPAGAQSVAQSPVVLAVPQPLAQQQLGWPDAKVTWAALLEKMTGGSPLKAGIVDPDRDASGLSGLLALSGAAIAAGGGQDAQQTTVAALRSLANNRSMVRADLVGKFPRAADATALSGALAAAPLSEQAVIAYNAAQPPVPLASVFLNPAPAPLDYPYAVLPSATNQAAGEANDLLGQLAGTAYRNQLARRGLRAADGSAGAGFNAGPGTPAKVAAAPAADPAAIGQMLNTWSAVTQAGRILAVLDVSGSMKTAVPTAGNKTREQVTVQAAAGGLGLFGDDWDVGLWTFSTKLNGSIPYRQLMPISPLATQRTQLNAALSAVVPTNGDTGLYDTVLAAYKAVQAGWDPAKVNSVVLMTDGQNDNPGGLTIDELTTQLQKIADPQRKVQVIAIGIGEASQAELTKITQVTGGGVFIASDPSKIGDIFLQAIALRPGSGG
jgi:hypothetical protein